MLFGHSFVKRLSCRCVRRGESVAQTLGLDGECALSSFGQDGLTFGKILSDPGRYAQHILASGQPDLLIVDVGSNDLGTVDTSVADVIDNASSFLEVLNANGVSPKRINFLSVIQRTSVVGKHGRVGLGTYNHRVKSFNARLAASILQRPHVALISQAKINRPKFICNDGFHLTEEGLTKYGYGVRHSIRQYLHSC